MEKYLIFIAPAIPFAAAIVLLILSKIKKKSVEKRKTLCCLSVQGEVVQIAWEKRGSTACYVYKAGNQEFFCVPYQSIFHTRKVAKRYPNAIHIAAAAKYNRPSKYAEGQMISLLCDPDNPKRHYIPGDDIYAYNAKGLKIAGIAFLFLGALSLLIAILGFIGIIPQQ